MSWNGYEHDVLLRNDGSSEHGELRFVNVGMAMGADNYGDGRGVAVADFDNDGDPDVVVNNGQGDSGDAKRARAMLYRNDVGGNRHWLQVELVGTTSNRDGIGAIVEVAAGGKKLMRHVHAGSAYSSQSTRRLLFGLGGATTVDRITVYWPSGAVDEYDDLGADQGIRLVEGGQHLLDVLPKSSGVLGGPS
jgi:hypothetical protein